MPVVADGGDALVIVDPDAPRRSRCGGRSRRSEPPAGSPWCWSATVSLPERCRRDAELTDRTATAAGSRSQAPLDDRADSPQLYFAEDGAERFILRHGLTGPFVERGRVLLRASETDWSLFNNEPEVAKTGAVVLYEQLRKPDGAALVEHGHGKGRIVVSTLDYRLAERFWRMLLTRLGVALRAAAPGGTPAFDEHGVLVRALSIGRFGATDLDTALRTDFLGRTAARSGVQAKGRTWSAVTCPSRDRFLVGELKQEGPADAFAVYFSFWLHSPRALDDLLLAGPDVPRLTLACYVAQRCRVFLNGRELPPAHTEPADYRTRLQFDGLPLKKGWNHVLIKLVATQLTGEKPGTLAVRLQSSQPAFLRQIESAVERRAVGSERGNDH
ncbi:MAG: hypothetical protein U0736_07540 [Gemmataceae bacterium]